ncbi:penicillin-binding protein activator [Meridianimarinicoccus roseus]|jgi:ABC-type branched-subunit amino acid transport system substrate-binding protein|uniref:Penicillin-binding protein activator n=1 Tax=Meridianimarinicoccus roseus TaxID=2072018 RepID=A0A2V2L7B7_9RHOB|nr:penicillin-binding protein activator [Meridianimarinicoccus roseus]PWR01338.1 penicillin-binding protein activator [Meridianimarinicoccus roseus]
MARFKGQFGRRAVIRSFGALALVGGLAACDPAAIGAIGGGSGSVQVALLVPTGAADSNVAFLGQNLTNAARLAVADLEGVEVDLRVYDTAGNAERAGQVATQAIAEGADVIVGPLFAEAANAAGLAAAAKGIPVMSFSNNPTVAGGNVFVMGPTFDNTARRLIGYARGQGKSSVLVMYGETEAERLGRDAAMRAAQDFGMSVVGTSGFAMSQEGVVAAVPGVVQQAKSTGADVLFLTSNTDTALPIVTQLLPENGLPPEEIQYVGLTRWDVPASALSLPGVQGGWFALPDTAAVNSFGSRYTAAYGQAPHSIAGLGYDGIAAVGALVGSGQRVTPQTLTQGRGFAGASGAFRFLQNGSNQRALSVATVQDKALRIVDPAPSNFASAGL